MTTFGNHDRTCTNCGRPIRQGTIAYTVGICRRKNCKDAFRKAHRVHRVAVKS